MIRKTRKLYRGLTRISADWKSKTWVLTAETAEDAEKNKGIYRKGRKGRNGGESKTYHEEESGGPMIG